MRKMIWLFCLTAFIAVSAGCAKDDPSPSDPGYLNNILLSGTWRVTYLKKTDEDKTGYFAGYHFTFTDTGVVVAKNGTNTYPGVWSVLKENDDIKLVISFASPTAFTELNDDWIAFEILASKVSLVDPSGSGSTDDYLTLEQD